MAAFGSTRDATRNILHTESYLAQEGDRGSPRELDVFTFEREVVNGTIKVYNATRRKQRVREWCMALKAELKEPASHVEILDEWYSKFLECHFQPNKKVEELVNEVCGVIERIPRVVDEFHDPLVDQPYSLYDAEYFLPDSKPCWETLRVTNFVSRNVLRIAIQIQIVLGGDSNYAEHYRLLLDATAEALREMISLSREDPWPGWFIVRAFFWTSWQRGTSLYHYYVLKEQLTWGYDEHRDVIKTPLQGSDMMRIAENLNRARADACHPPYICKWALRLLREDKAVVGQDYRRFFERLSQAFSDREARCVISSDGEPAACDGRQPGKCLRLSGMRITNQSAHAPDCDGRSCSSLYWNEESWRGVGGAAAVSLVLGTDGRLNYVQASSKTVAVSHVWSHGQGGRPEDEGGTGLNSCLFRRYSRVAEMYGCDSFWMDTPCIPSDHVLRGEAIANINLIFATSKLTLVCDKDLMAIDFQDEDIATKEAIVSMVLVCDWNVRAWTLLEALRGRQNIHILCKNDVVVSLKDVLMDVCNQGSIDIAALFLSAQHLLPSQAYIHGLGNDHPYQSSQWIVNRRKGFVEIKEAAGLLSHRQASRPGDAVIIWSLLCGDTVFDKAEDIWRNQQGRGVPSGWLVSSYERLSVKGLSWAPSRPNFSLHGEDSPTDYDKLLLPYHGIETRVSAITERGLHGDWWAYRFKVKRTAWERVLERFTGGCLPLERAAGGYLDGETWCATLRPLHTYRRDVWVPHPRRLSKAVFAVVASDDGEAWRWKGVLELDEGVVLPQFRTMGFLIE
ncbi:uncharacterized protein TRIREDRAFT_108682 [Trichoderma reesei QM6a]|uniref:Predicted protein n=2 Tax=Hypocrea jecorina TaxID=51453 RepID=G0RN36_HYPJQ|nr:uncharacterized protein TRIREDRAFT_108682 [Trichoderma reesei QM6a]EGR47376.1 predicted protein [Trichoderma reesei QM6a]ETS01008.1 hypothetical protein M419DRAFT_82275 [Trichoderma reesei RUT C-30]